MSIVLTWYFEVDRVQIVDAYSTSPSLEVIIELDNVSPHSYYIDINLEVLVNQEHITSLSKPNFKTCTICGMEVLLTKNIDNDTFYKLIDLIPSENIVIVCEMTAFYSLFPFIPLRTITFEKVFQNSIIIK